MELTPEQKEKVAGWIAEGLSLSEIQKRLVAVSNAMHATYCASLSAA